MLQLCVIKLNIYTFNALTVSNDIKRHRNQLELILTEQIKFVHLYIRVSQLSTFYLNVQQMLSMNIEQSCDIASMQITMINIFDKKMIGVDK